MSANQTNLLLEPFRKINRHPLIFLSVLGLVAYFVLDGIRSRAHESAYAHFMKRCEEDAGRFVYKTIDNVEGFVLMRRRDPSRDYYERMREGDLPDDPYGHSNGIARNPKMFVNAQFGHYRYLELPRDFDPHVTEVQARRLEQSAWIRYDWDFGTNEDAEPVEIEHPRSRYGVVWHSFQIAEDARHGVYGGETLVLDLQQDEVLGKSIGYMLFYDKYGIRTVDGCPKGRKPDDPRSFVESILNPRTDYTHTDSMQ